MGRSGGRKEGWGSAEATEMVLNNIFYITAKVSVGQRIVKILQMYNGFSLAITTLKKSNLFGPPCALHGRII